MGHCIAGIAAGEMTRPESDRLRTAWAGFLCGAACVPDVDYVLGAMGFAGSVRYTHSLAGSLAFPVLLAAGWRIVNRTSMNARKTMGLALAGVPHNKGGVAAAMDYLAGTRAQTAARRAAA